MGREPALVSGSWPPGAGHRVRGGGGLRETIESLALSAFGVLHEEDMRVLLDCRLDSRRGARRPTNRQRRDIDIREVK
jgi:hypothetical protein